MDKILITGGTGLVGLHLNKVLKSKGFKTALLSRSKRLHPDYDETFFWDPDNQQIDIAAFKECSYIVHLAGQNIAEKKWSQSVKKQIIASRVNSSKLLYQTIEKDKFPIKAIVAASAIGFYGSRNLEVIDETAPQGKDFLSEVCKAWEASTQPFSALTRLVQFRIGIVLSTRGGALAQMLKSAKMGTAIYLGGGQQYYSWIHIDDLCGIILHALRQEEVSGVYNAVSPVVATQMTITDTLRYALKNPTLTLPIPAWTLRLAMGEMSALVLNSSKVSAQKIINTGYVFQFKTPADAIYHLLKENI